jgi:hypothetical protein
VSDGTEPPAEDELPDVEAALVEIGERLTRGEPAALEDAYRSLLIVLVSFMVRLFEGV